MTVKAPWTKEQVENLKKIQITHIIHPYTCGICRDEYGGATILIPTKDGWVCPNCEYRQDWAHKIHADGELFKEAENRKYAKEEMRNFYDQFEKIDDPTTCKCGKEGKERIDHGLRAGVHCDECWERMVRKARSRSW